MKQMKQILEGVYNNSELRKSIVPLFLGDPGLGKTKIIEGFAKEKGVNLVELITSQMSPFEISGIAMPDKELQKMIYYNFDKLENYQQNIIIINHLLFPKINTRPRTIPTSKMTSKAAIIYFFLDFFCKFEA